MRIVRWSLCILPMLASLAVAQYKTSYNWSTKDITSYAISGTNAWKYLAGNPQCLPQSMVVSSDQIVWCIGTDNYPYSFNVVTHTWTKQSAMGTGMTAMVVQNANNVFAAKLNTSHCGLFGGVQSYELWQWNGSAWNEPNTGACATNYTISADGFLAAAGWDATNNARALYYSTDNGANWTLWSDSWSYVYMSGGGSGNETGCAITQDGTGVFLINSGNPAIATSALPSGTASQCFVSLGPDPVFMALGTNGAVYMQDSSTNAWDTVAGPTATQLAGQAKGMAFILDSSNKPYHWNVYALSITGTIGGTYDNFPMGSLKPPPQHTGKIQVKFPHSLDGALHSQTIPYNGQMNVSSSDTNPLCDPLFGGDDPECQPSTTGSETCSIAGFLGNPQEPSGIASGVSIDERWWLADDPSSIPPEQLGTLSVGDWITKAAFIHSDACGIGQPTCPTPRVISANAACHYKDPSGYTPCQAEVTAWWNVWSTGINSPYVITTPYVKSSGGVLIECLANGPPVPYNGQRLLMPSCQ